MAKSSTWNVPEKPVLDPTPVSKWSWIVRNSGINRVTNATMGSTFLLGTNRSIMITDAATIAIPISGDMRYMSWRFMLFSPHDVTT